MKQLILLSFFSILLISCKESKQKKTISKDTSTIAINNLLNNWHKAASNADYDGYFNKMDNISVFIGTDATENWNKLEFAEFSKPYFEKGKAWSFKTLERNIYIDDNNKFAWFDELLETWMGTCRGSGVLQYKTNKWKIKHYVLSVAIPNDDINKVIAAKQKNDSIFLTTKK